MGLGSGRYLRPEEIERIIVLLRTSNLTLPEIATRMGCTRSTIVAINRKHRIRDYGGRRLDWTVIG